MPALSKAFQAVTAIALHNPSKLKKRNRGVLRMSKEQLRDFASTPTKDLPDHKGENVPLSSLMRGKKRKK